MAEVLPDLKLEDLKELWLLVQYGCSGHSHKSLSNKLD